MKLKGIDGGPHKRWSMWFNSTQREEPYQGLTSRESLRKKGVPARERGDRWCMAVVSSCREMLVKSRNERNPHLLLPSGHAGHSRGTAPVNGEEGGDDVKSSCPLRPGLHTCYNGRYKGMPHREVELNPKSRSKFRLESATRLHEGGIASNRVSARRGEYVPGPCTHRPSHHESQLYSKSPS